MSKLDRALVGDGELEDPRLIELPRGTRLMAIEALAWCAKHRTDGQVTRAALHRLTDEPDPEAAAAALVEAAVWRATPVGWSMDWSRQLEARDVEQIDNDNRKRWQGQKRHQRGQHGDWCPKSCPDRGQSADTESEIGPMSSGQSADMSAVSTRYEPNRTSRSEPFGIERGSNCVRCGKPFDPLAVTEYSEQRRGIQHIDCVEPESSPPDPPPIVTVDCRDYARHQAAHRKTKNGWTCDVCSPELVGAKS